MINTVASATFTERVLLRIVHYSRRTCPSCHRRRVVYAIEVTAGHQEEFGWPEGGQTIARCASCMGLRE